MNTPHENKRPKSIERIAEAVSNLIVPSLAALYQTFLDQKAGIGQKRTELVRRREEVRNEGFEAATRFMAPTAEQIRNADISYLELIKRQRGGRHE
jgi:hypothetical protein